MKKNDLILISVIIFIAIIILLIFNFINSDIPQDSLTVRITSMGELYREVPLSEDTTIKIETEDGYNIIVINDFSVSVTEADCKNQICVNTAPATNIGDTIVCLPHELIIEIVDSNN
jgi:hypothetical protein